MEPVKEQAKNGDFINLFAGETERPFRFSIFSQMLTAPSKARSTARAGPARDG